MNKRSIVFAGIGVVVLLLGVALVVPALADEPEEGSCPGYLGRFSRGFGIMGFGARGGWTVFDTVAETLGLTPEELFSKLHGGDTLADIAGDDLDAVHEAVGAVRSAAVQEAIEQAVTDGRLTQEQADWLLKGQELGFMPGRRGSWGGMKGHFRGSMRPRGPLAPSTTSS
jgi:hypothetical protein